MLIGDPATIYVTVDVAFRKEGVDADFFLLLNGG